MRKSNRTWSLKALILISCLCCMVLAMLLQMVLFNASSSSVIAGQTAEINRSTLENMSDEIYTSLKRIENGLVSVYEYKDFIRLLSATGDTDTLRQEYAALAYEMANTAFDTSDHLVALYLYTMEHRLISSYRHAQTPIYSYPADIYDHTMRGSEADVQAIIDANPSVMTVTSYENPKRGLRLVRCVLRILENAQTSIGYMVCDIDPKGLQASMEKYRYSQEQAVWLQPAGRLAAVSVLPKNGQTQAAYASLERAGAEGQKISPGKSPFSLFSASVRKYDMQLYSLIPSSALNTNQVLLMNSTAVVFAAVLALFGVLFFFISRSLTRPLTQMVDTMNRIRKGETELRLPPLRQDELGKLGSTFNAMLDQIESLIASQYQTAIQLNDTKYKALQMQVNPHFLYNTLDTMGAIAMSRECPLVSTLCHALSELFRYSLRMDEPLAPMTDELKHLKNYLFVMNVRMNDSIHLTTSIPAELMKVRLPRLSLQPLVENAIEHGLRNKRGEKSIQINACRTRNEIRLSIIDNGVGMPQEILSQMQSISPDDALSTGSSIGLLNIAARVRLLFGKHYGLTVQSSEGEGTVVTLHIPAAQEDEQNG